MGSEDVSQATGRPGSRDDDYPSPFLIRFRIHHLDFFDLVSGRRIVIAGDGILKQSPKIHTTLCHGLRCCYMRRMLRN